MQLGVIKDMRKLFSIIFYSFALFSLSGQAKQKKKISGSFFFFNFHYRTPLLSVI